METKFNKKVEHGGAIGSPSFWAYNGNKLPFVAFLCYGSVIGFFAMVGFKFNKDFFIITLFFGTFWFVLCFWLSYRTFVSIAKILQPYRPDSVLPLFREGYSFRHEKSRFWFLYTSPKIEGVIDGVDVIVTYDHGGEDKLKSIHFDFFPVYVSPADEVKEMKLEVGLNTDNLNEGVESIVRAYTRKMIEDGYTGQPVRI